MNNYGLKKQFNQYEKINKYIKLLIFLFPVMVFIGPYLKLNKINLSNIYSLVLAFVVIYFFAKNRYKFINLQMLFFVMLIIYAVSSLIWSEFASIGYSIILPLTTGVFTMIFISGLNEIELKYFIKVINIFTITVLILSLYEIFEGYYLFFDNLMFNYKNQYGFNYPGVCFTNPNDLGQYLILGSSLLLFTLWEKNNNLAFSLVIICSIFITLQTGSRLTLMSLIIVLIMYLLNTIKINKRTIFNIFIIGFTMVLIYLLLQQEIDLSSYNIIDDFLLVDNSQGYYMARSYIYRSIFNLALDNILLGSGIGGSYYVSVLGPHNFFLFILSDFGIIFALSFIFLLIGSFIKLFRYRAIELSNLYLSRIMISILIVFPLFSSISSGNEQRKVVWILLGLIFTTIKNYKKGEIMKNDKFNI